MASLVHPNHFYMENLSWVWLAATNKNRWVSYDESFPFSWWFQPVWKTCVKLEIFPKIGGNIKNNWNHFDNRTLPVTRAKQLKPSFQCALFIHNSETSLYDEPDVARGMVGSSNSCMNLQYYCWWFRNLANHLGFTLNTGIKLPIIYSNWCRISSINNNNWSHNVADRSRWREKCGKYLNGRTFELPCLVGQFILIHMVLCVYYRESNITHISIKLSFLNILLMEEILLTSWGW